MTARLILLFALFYALDISAQPTLLAGPQRVDTSHSYARFLSHWSVDSISTLRVGTNASFTDERWQVPMFGSSSVDYATHAVFLSGLQASTEYHVQACAFLQTYTYTTTSGNKVQITGHGYSNGNVVGFHHGSPETAALVATNAQNYGLYLVVNATANDFELTKLDGTPITFAGSVATNAGRRLGLGACSTTQTFTTDALPAVHPALPEPPDAVIPTPPTVFAQTYTVTDNGACSDLQTKLNEFAVVTDGSNREIIIPDVASGFECRGHYDLPSRHASSTGKIVVRTSSSAFLPAGKRVTDAHRASGKLAKITNNIAPVGSVLGAGTIHAGSAVIGSLYLTNTFATSAAGLTILFRASTSAAITDTTKTIESLAADNTITITGHGYTHNQLVEVLGSGSANVNGTWIIKNVTANTFQLHGPSGSATPCSGGSCTGTARVDSRFVPVENSVWGPAGSRNTSTCTSRSGFSISDIYIEDGALPSTMWWCEATNVWGKYKAVNGLSDFAIDTPQTGTARDYWLIGLDVQYPQWPNAFPNWDNATTQNQGRVTGLIRIWPSTSDIVIDRSLIHSRPFPNRTGGPFQLDGTRTALMNSRVYEMASWGYTSATTIMPGLLEVSAIQIFEGGNGVIYNNYFSGSGISIYFSDGGQDRTSPSSDEINTQWVTNQHDYIIQRNTFDKDPKDHKGTAENVAYGWDTRNRHHMEWKRGVRMKVWGNKFLRNYNSGEVQGSPVLVTPVNNDFWADAPLTSIDGDADTLVYTTVTGENFDWINVGAYVSVTGTATHNGLYQVLGVNQGTNTLTVSDMPAGTEASGTVTSLDATPRVTDIDLAHNTFSGTPLGFQWNGHGNQDTPVTGQTRRTRIFNMLVEDMNGRGCRGSTNTATHPLTGLCDVSDFGWIAGNANDRTSGVSSYLLSNYFGPEDVTVDHVTVVKVRGGTNGQQIVRYDNAQYGKGEGLKVSNVLFAQESNADSEGHMLIHNTAPITHGDAGLLLSWTNPVAARIAATSPVVNTGDYAANTLDSSKTTPADFRFEDYTNGDYRLRFNSPFKSGATTASTGGVTPYKSTDGLDLGADISVLHVQQGKVKNPRVRSVTSTAAVLSYFAPDAEACTVEVSASADWGTGTQTSDGGGARNRNVDLTLTAGSSDYVRLLCAVEQFSCPETGGRCTIQ